MHNPEALIENLTQVIQAGPHPSLTALEITPQQALSGRAIGWWIKERYRSMRGYKSKQSVLNVSRLIAYCGNNLAQGLDLANLVA